MKKYLEDEGSSRKIESMIIQGNISHNSRNKRMVKIKEKTTFI